MAERSGRESYYADGEAIERLRRAKGLTKSVLFAEAEIDQKTLNRAIAGKRTSLDALIGLAKALEVNWEQLVALDKEPELARKLNAARVALVQPVPPSSPKRNVRAGRVRKTFGTNAPPAPTRRVVSPSPVSLSAEDQLQEFAAKAARAVDADACSIFMWDDDADLYVLRESESPLLKPFLGRLFLDHTVDPKLPGRGITNRCASTAQSQLIHDVRKDPGWSGEHPCELPAEQLQSLIAMPIGWRLVQPIPQQPGTLAEQHPRGILRVVRSKDKEPFRSEHERTLESLQSAHATTLAESESFTRLMSLGLALSTRELCKRATEILGHLVRAKGCSIFLLEDLRSDANGQHRYRCFGSTGLHSKTRRGQRPLRIDEAVYTVPAEASDHLTAFVITERRNLVIDDASTYDFKRELGISRSPGSGKSSETFVLEPNLGSGPFMAVPLFFRERFDPSFPALGAIRAARPKGSQPFAEAEQRRFFALAEQLAKAIVKSCYHELLDAIALAPVDQPFEQIASKVVAEVPKLLGGAGCSLWLGNPTLKMIATYGHLEQEFQAGKVGPYNVNDKKKRGITGAAVHRCEAIWYNSLEERTRWARNKGVRWSGRKQCEIDQTPESLEVGPVKLVVAPIVSRGKAIGAIRVPKNAIQISFSGEEDIPILLAIGRHMGALIEKLERGHAKPVRLTQPTRGRRKRA